MKIRCLLMLLVNVLFLFDCNLVKAQYCLSFSYDENGNREQRLAYDCAAEKETLGDQEEIKDIQDIQEVTDVSEERDIIVYPNPTNGNFKIVVKNYKQEEQTYINLYDVYGNVQLSDLLTGNYNEVDITDRSSGAYMLKIMRGDDIRTMIILKQ